MQYSAEARTGKVPNAVSLPDFTMRQLLEAGAHFGHQSHRWNPKMAPYIYGARNSIHIIDLAQTVPLLHQALKLVSDTVSKGGRVLFVGTKRQASQEIAESARRCAQYFVNSRWLGGTLTNWKTISGSINRLRKVDEQLAEGAKGLTKKERLMLMREKDKLEKALGGIKDMGGVPDLVFVIDTNKERSRSRRRTASRFPVIAILDTNSDPDGVAHPIPANDDASRAIQLYCDLIARAAIDGISRGQGAAGRRPRRGREAGRRDSAGHFRGRRAGFLHRAVRAARRAARRARRSRQDPRHRPADREEAQRAWRVPLLAARRDDPDEAQKLDTDLRFNGRITRDKWSDAARNLIAAE